MGSWTLMWVAILLDDGKCHKIWFCDMKRQICQSQGSVTRSDVEGGEYLCMSSRETFCMREEGIWVRVIVTLVALESVKILKRAAINASHTSWLFWTRMSAPSCYRRGSREGSTSGEIQRYSPGQWLSEVEDWLQTEFRCPALEELRPKRARSS